MVVSDKMMQQFGKCLTTRWTQEQKKKLPKEKVQILNLTVVLPFLLSKPFEISLKSFIAVDLAILMPNT